MEKTISEKEAIAEALDFFMSSPDAYQKKNDPRDSEGQSKPYTFDVYETDKEGNDVKFIKWFEDVNEAVDFAKTLSFPTHVIFNPNDDVAAEYDDDNDSWQFFEYPYSIDPLEVVWDSYKPEKKIKQLVRY